MLTVQEVADKYSVTKPCVYGWIKRGLPTTTQKKYGIKPRFLIDDADIREFLELDKGVE